ncbi:hypothetical protein ACFRAO_36585 [Streptomyces sp. NPDC056656]|uniref:hypothetical protein n=1 Tax=Streptomyces sp. NPDC056656 TaxID=3345895 RepID=UPI00367EFA55
MFAVVVAQQEAQGLHACAQVGGDVPGLLHGPLSGGVGAATPALASLTLGPKGILSAAAGACAVTVITASLHRRWGGQVYSALLSLLVVSVASVAVSNAMRRRRQIELDQVRGVAEAAQ